MNPALLDRLLHQAPALRVPLLLLTHAAGSLLVLAAPLATLLAGGGALLRYGQVQGPLDWLVLETLAGIALLGAYLTVQLARLRPSTPAGVEINEAVAPALFVSMAHRVAHFRVPPVRQVLLTTDVELRIVATPRLALPFLHHYSLCVGAPLTFFYNRGQFGLALAGAVAAMADSRSRLGGRLLQASDDWPLILDSLSLRDNLLCHLLYRPLQAVSAMAQTLSEPLRTDWRQQQGQWLRNHHEEQHAAACLANQVVAAAFMKKQYWPMIMKGAERCASPVVKAFSHLPLLLGKTLNPTLAERWLLQAQTASGAAESGIRDLLAELRIERLTWSGLPEPSAFRTLFKSVTVLKELDNCWQQSVEAEWRRRHARFQEDQTRFEQLQKRAAEGALRDAAALRYVKLCSRFLKPDDVAAACRRVYGTNRDDARVCFAAGVALLRNDAGADGIQALQRAAELDPSLARRVRALIDEHQHAWVGAAAHAV